MARVRPKPPDRQVKARRPSRPKAKSFLLEPPPRVFRQLLRPIITLKSCCKACTATVSLLPRIGGIDSAHTLRVPVFGPFVRASAFNGDDATHAAEVRACLST